MKEHVILLILLLLCSNLYAQTDDYDNLYDEDGNEYSSSSSNFNKHNKDTTNKNKEIPKGMRVWKIDRRFGDVTPSVPDTMHHLFHNTIFNTGMYGQYNTTGNNYTPRQNRIIIDRDEKQQFLFTQPYDHVMKEPDEINFTNTLSPITNISYDNCGNKTNGEDHIDALFATNVNKRFGFGFDINYAYARGYYANQSTSHFGFTLFGSYIGDKYSMHAMLSTYHQKVAENGGITDDMYITHPETFSDSYMTDEIPTVLEENWNRNHNLHLFLSHRYNIGFYRQVPMTEEEIKAKKFAEEAQKDKEERDRRASGNMEGNRLEGRPDNAPMGRPDDAMIMGDEPPREGPHMADSTKIISLEERIKLDSLAIAKAIEDSIAATMKSVYIPVTSFIHTLDFNRHTRSYIAYQSPDDYYLNTYYDANPDNEYSNDSIYDDIKFTQMKNTLAIAMMEGFNKWAKAGIKIFATHELRKVEMVDLATEYVDEEETILPVISSWTENNLSIGGQILKTNGRAFHYNLLGEIWMAGEDAGAIKLDLSTDLNIPLLGDTLRIGAKAHIHRTNPTFFERKYHSKHLWWDNSLDEETRTGVEGVLQFAKTHTTLRFAIESIKNYTYFGVSYDATTTDRTNMTAGVYQEGSNITLTTAQLKQDFRLGPLNWENIVTWQNSSNESALPAPEINLFTNLYLKFKVVKELSVELGADMFYWTKYYAPDYCPQISQYAVQLNEDSRVKIGGYPFLDVYANMHLKHTRFYVMMSHVTGGSGSMEYFLSPHYPSNGRIFRFGLSWNFFN